MDNRFLASSSRIPSESEPIPRKKGLSLSIRVVVAYEGEQLQQRTEGSLIPWRELRDADFWKPDTVV